MAVRSRLIETYLDGLILYYPFHEGAGAFAEDLSPFKRHGTITNCAWVSGPLEHALQFSSGADDHVDTKVFAFASATNILAFTGWINIAEAPAGSYTIFNDNSGTDPYIWINLQGSSLFASLNDAGAQFSVKDLNFFTTFISKWVHFAVVIDFTSRTVDFYRDGIWRSQATGGTDWHFPNTNATKRLGQTTAGTWKLNGLLDEFRVFDRVLTPTEVFQDYYKAARQQY